MEMEAEELCLLKGKTMYPLDYKATYRHKVRGTTYKILHLGTLQVSDNDLDMTDVIIYQCQEDGTVWVRPESEFVDGRFEKVDT
ncbi:hypothetical protein EVC27_088 [Rhizobium phage RHph_I1_6]|uniref:DUF1653 domain-containing protein n=1 Tax=Rhizobium phage RHph_I1_6 TaxID=2509728 RepID=A0A7S5V2B2_9CAUD|nr:hypothetical protein PP745_gp088 [Rhizobium phage RHph_I1_6]QIG76613.1 hypothetical protein EVC27_088 [Rhizobium phage RHph_I1_6]